MKRKKCIKIITKILSLTLLFTSIFPTQIYADSKTVDSIGSINEQDDGVLNGVDATQTKKTTYSGTLTSDTPKELTDVYVSQASTFGVTIPKVLIIDGKKNESNVNTSRYVVEVSGNIGGLEHVDVVPDATCTLKQNAKNDIVATITQDKTSWMWNEFTTSANGLLSTNKLTAGKWSGAFNFNVMIVSPNTPTDSEVITLSQEELIIGPDGAKQIEAYSGGKNITTTSNWVSDNPNISVVDGYIETTGNTQPGDFANVTVTIEKDQIAMLDNDSLLSKLLLLNDVVAEDSITTTLRVEIVEINIEKEEIEVTTIDAKPSEEFFIKAVLSSNPLNKPVTWSATAIGGMNMVKNGNEVKLKLASDMPIGNVYQLIATYGDYSKLVHIKIVSPHTHNYTSVVTKEPTCLEKGIKTFTCECGDVYMEEINALGHVYTAGNYVIDKTQTCTENGSKSIHCNVCGMIIPNSEQSISSYGGHIYKETIVPQTELKQGYTLHECTRCGDSYKDNFVGIEYVEYAASRSAGWGTGNITIPETFTQKNGLGQIINYKVTSVATHGFSYSNQYISVVLPNTIKRIESSAFSSCTELKSINLPSELNYIGDFAFSTCKLSSVTIPNKVTTIGERAFAGNLFTTISIPSSVTTISKLAFSGCPNLTTVNIEYGLKRIEMGTFDPQTLKTITIPTSVTYISSTAFGSNPNRLTINYAGKTYTSFATFKANFGGTIG